MKIALVDAALPERIVLIQMTTTAASSSGEHSADAPDEDLLPSKVISSGDEHPVDEHSVEEHLNRATERLKLFSEAAHTQEAFASVLLFPVLKSKDALGSVAEGTKLHGPVDMKAILVQLERAFQLAGNARQHSGAPDGTRTLSNRQFEQAFDWLQI